MVRKPFPHQAETLEWAEARRLVAILHEMRLGKTYTTYLWSQLQRPPYLVTCPPEVVDTWVRELGFNGIKPTVIRGSEKQKLKLLRRARGDWFIAHFPSLIQVTRPRRPRATPANFLLAKRWGTIIVDESYGIKNPKAKVTKVLCQLSAPSRAILSGLPDPEGPLDLFSQYKFLRGSFMGCWNFWTWRRRYFHPAGFKWLPNSGTESKIAAAISECSHLLSAEAAGIFMPKVSEVLRFALPGNIRKLYSESVASFTMCDRETKYAAVMWTWLLRLCGGCGWHAKMQHRTKIKVLTQLLEENLRRKSVVVWCNFNSEVEAVAKAIKGTRPVRRVSGVLGQRHKKEAIRWFHRSAPGAVLVAQIKSITRGEDLACGEAAVFFSTTASLERRKQSEARILNPNRKTAALVIDIVAEDTVESELYDLMRDKSMNSLTLRQRMLARLRQQWKEK